MRSIKIANWVHNVFMIIVACIGIAIIVAFCDYMVKSVREEAIQTEQQVDQLSSESVRQIYLDMISAYEEHRLVWNDYKYDNSLYGKTRFEEAKQEANRIAAMYYGYVQETLTVWPDARLPQDLPQFLDFLG